VSVEIRPEGALFTGTCSVPIACTPWIVYARVLGMAKVSYLTPLTAIVAGYAKRVPSPTCSEVFAYLSLPANYGRDAFYSLTRRQQGTLRQQGVKRLKKLLGLQTTGTRKHMTRRGSSAARFVKKPKI
jgi:hypothetical protein